MNSHPYGISSLTATRSQELLSEGRRRQLAKTAPPGHRSVLREPAPPGARLRIPGLGSGWLASTVSAPRP